MILIATFLLVLLCKPDVGDESTYKSAVATVTELVGDQGLNVLFNNAGMDVQDGRRFDDVTADKMRLYRPSDDHAG